MDYFQDSLLFVGAMFLLASVISDSIGGWAMKILIYAILWTFILGPVSFKAQAQSLHDRDTLNLLRLRGVPGQEQPTDYCVLPYKKSKAGWPVVFSGLQRNCARLGQGVRVPPGPVLVLYSGSILLTEKRAHQELVLDLINIEVFPENSAGSFRVWIDLSKESEQEKLMLKNWISNIEKYNACVKSPVFMDSQAYHEACDPYLGTSNFRKGMGQVFTFSASGMAHFPRGFSVGESLAPGSIALLPGSYVIEWTGLRNGDSAKDRRILVK